MKKLILIIAVIFCMLQVSAQMHISTSSRTNAVFNTSTEEYETTSTDEFSITVFNFNKDLTMIKHVTEGITSAYTITNTHENKKNNCFEFDIVSDVGNKYFLIFDPDRNNIRFIYDSGTEVRLVQYEIKRAWFDD